MEYNTYDAKTLIFKALNIIEERLNHIGTIKGYSTGFSTIDNFTDGFQPGQLITIGSYELRRKAFPFCLLHNILLKSHVPCALFTFEERPEDVGLRLLSLYTKMPYRRLRYGLVSEDKIKLLNDTAHIFTNSQFVTVECHLMEFEELCNAVRKQCALNEIKVIFIHTLNFIPLDKETGNRHERILSILQKLKRLAVELDVCIVLPFYIDDSEKEKTLEKKIHFLQMLSDVTMILKRESLIQKDSSEISYNLSIISEISSCELNLLMNNQTQSFKENNRIG